MTPLERERWQKVRAVFDEAVDAESAVVRAAVLDQRCGEDSELREEVERLLAQEERGDLLLDTLRDAVAPRRRKAGDLVAGRYRLTRFLASGGMGDVFAAQDESEGGAPVALKFVRPGANDLSTDDIRARFRREARLASGIRHPNCCRVLAFVEVSSEEAFCVMELLEGETLAAILEREGPLPAGRVREVLRQLCAGLDAAHRAGVLHRDLKPGNVLLEPDGRVVIIDFGLAAGTLSRQETLTAPGAVIGTLAYMAPEQMEDGVATAASDLYALGAMAFEMLTGTKPHAALSPLRLAIERSRASSERAPVARLSPLPPLWQEVIGRCLRRDPRARFRSAAQLAAQLERGRASVGFWLSRPSVAGPLMAVFLLLVGIGAWDWWCADYIPRAEAMALYREARTALAEGAPERATALLQQAVDREPRFLAAGALLAVAHAHAGRLDESRHAVLCAVTARDACWRVGRAEGRKLHAARAAVMGDYRSAADWYRQLADAEGSGPEERLARLLQADMLERQGQRREAVRVLEELVREGGPAGARVRLERLMGPRASRK